MTNNLVTFDVGKLNEAITEDGRSANRLSKDARIDRKTLKKAQIGEPVRRAMAIRISTELAIDLTKLVRPEDKTEIESTTVIIDLTESSINSDLISGLVYSSSRESIRVLRAIAIPCSAAEIVTNLNEAGRNEQNERMDHRPNPDPIWDILPDVERSEALTDCLKKLDIALKQRAESLGARTLDSLISSLEKEDLVAESLEQLAKIDARILSTVLKIQTNNGAVDYEFLRYCNYYVPVFIIAGVGVDRAIIKYHSLLDIPEEDEDVPF